MRTLRNILLGLLPAMMLLCSWQRTAAENMQAANQSKNVSLRTFSMVDGLPSNSFAMMSVGKNGLLWLATWNGLCNYDGYRFNTFLNVPGAKDVLHGNRLNYAFPSDNGDVWLTTYDDRLFLLDASQRRFVSCEDQLKSLGLDDFHVQYMQSLDDGALWIQSADGVDLIARDGKLERTDRKLEKTDPGKYTDSKGRIWSMADDGSISCRRSPESAASVEYTCTFSASWPKINADAPVMLEDKSGTMWFLPNGGTVCYFDETQDRLVPINLRDVDHTLPDEVVVTHAVVDKQKNLWFRGNFNLCQMLFGDNNFKFTPIVDGSETRSIFIDSGNRLWTGTKQGHLALLQRDKASPQFLTSAGTFSNLPAIFDAKGIYSIYEDSRHNVWIGTRGNGLYRLVPKGAAYDVEHYRNNMTDPLYGYNHVYDIREDTYGRIWLASYGGGIVYFDTESQTFFTGDNTPGLRLPEGNINKVRRIEIADDGTLIFSTTEGIVTLDSNFKTPSDIRLNITKYASGGSNSLLAPDVLQTLVNRHDNTAYVATMGGGLQKIESAGILQDNLDFGDVEHNFPNMGNIRGMTEDLHGNLWLVGENALHCFAHDEKDRHTCTINDFGGRTVFSEAKPILDRASGEIVLGTLDGLISFSPDAVQSISYVPEIVFTGIQYQGDAQQSPLTGNGEITLPTDRHNATIYFVALDYEDNLQVRYAFRIRELDKKWNYVGLEHCASLSNLPPGHYTLEVRSTNNEGIWVDNTTELRIYVEPTFWQTPWAWVIYALLAAIIIFGSIYLLWLRKAHRMEKDVNERQLRFFTDISHRVRTPLTLIDGPLTEVLNTEKLSEKAHNLLISVKNNSSEMLKLVNEALDLQKLRSSEAHTGIEAEDYADGAENTLDTAAGPETTGLTILIVEDNAELRYFLNTSLSAQYNIIEAENGKEGLKLAAERQPDFIITDVMMPEMDGITMLRNIKADPAICHIPIVILSARTADVYRIEGLREGADDYITKPFSMSYLQARVESIVRQRHMMQEEWRKSLAPAAEAVPPEDASAHTPVEKTISEIDRKFVENITAFINENIENADLKIDDLATAMCMSRTVLYGKIKAIYGMAPNDVLRNIRIARACTNLREHPEMSVTDVALSVGYNDPKYFARYFRQIVGKSPSEYRKSTEG